MLSTEEANQIRKLWTDPTFPGIEFELMLKSQRFCMLCKFLGSFSGLITFQKNLQSRNIHVSLRELKDVLSHLPDYLQAAQAKKRFTRRKYWNHGYVFALKSELVNMQRLFTDGSKHFSATSHT